jgi:DNA-binding XRE family transcriptional regulator
MLPARPAIPNALRSCRLECGLTQGELASRAGVSRQLVAAVESGRNVPSVDAALRLAAALGSSVEALFGVPAAPDVTAAVDDQLPDGALLRVARVGERLVGAELSDHGVAGAWWAKPDGVWRGGRLRMFAGGSRDALVLAGCEPAFGIAEQMLAGLGARSLLAISAASGRALEALVQERVHAAVVHGPDGSLPAPGPVRRVRVARWRVGLAVPHSFRGELDALLAAGMSVIQREPTASIQQAFGRALARAGASSDVPGPRASGPREAARLAATLDCAALTTEAAAAAFKLRFIPLEEHVVELWIGEQWLDHPGADALQELLSSRAFTERVAQYGGYDLTGCGSLV